jgi:hypothetical protein
MELDRYHNVVRNLVCGVQHIPRSLSLNQLNLYTMQLRTNGPVVSAYRWLYGINRYKLGNNFCPIFWMMVLGAVLIIPYAIFCIPAILLEVFDKNYENGDRSFGERLGISVFSYLGLFALFAISEFALSLLGYMEFGKDATVAGAIMTTGLAIIVAVVYARKYINYRRDKADKIKWEKIENGEIIPDSIGTVIANTWSSFYDKHCPRITWIDPKDPTPNNHNETDDEVLEGMELGVHTDPVLGTTYGLKNITNTGEYLEFPNLKP